VACTNRLSPTPPVMSNRSIVSAVFMIAVCGACSTPTAAAPDAAQLPEITAASPFRSAAFTADISTVRRAVKISAPTATASLSSSLTGFGAALHGSILGGDAVDLVASNYTAGVIGASVPGKVLITFDLTVVNRLRGLRLITPTFPIPPANVVGIQAFPIETVALTSAGGVTTTGGAITVTSPRSGIAVPSADWDGAPHNFFNDSQCAGAASDCFRYEPFGTIDALASSTPRRVGFLIDPSVGDLRVRILIAADLQAVPR